MGEALSRLVAEGQGDIHIASRAFDIVGVERLGVSAFQDAALATRLAVVQALPRFEHIRQSLLSG